MARTATARPPAEHVATLARVQRQVGVDEKMKQARRRRVMKLLAEACGELQREAVER